mgnify:CR=1 FL=1
MSNVLFVGKDLPDSLDFAETLSKNNRKVFVTEKLNSEVSNFDSANIFKSPWNRSSAISSRALIINAESKIQPVDEFIIYFDSYYYASKFSLDRTEDLPMAIDTCISGYQFFVNELLFRLEQKKEPSVIVFLVRTAPSKAELINNTKKNPNLRGTSNIVCAAQAAFISFAESIATLVNDKSYLSVLLSQCSTQNDLYNNEKELAEWVCQSIDTLKNQKNHQTVKQALNWVKAGAKISSGFSFFK